MLPTRRTVWCLSTQASFHNIHSRFGSENQQILQWETLGAKNDSNYCKFSIAHVGHSVRRSIVAALTAQYPGIYTNENIALVSTHQHSGVGGCGLFNQLSSNKFTN